MPDVRTALISFCLIHFATPLAAFCQVDQAILEARLSETMPGFIGTDNIATQWHGVIFHALDYGEYFYLYLNRPDGDRRVVGDAVIRVKTKMPRIKSDERELFVGLWTLVGSPYMGYTSWHSLQEIPIRIVWREFGPILTDEPFWSQRLGDEMAVGDKAFEAIDAGPLKGYDLILVGCQS